MDPILHGLNAAQYAAVSSPSSVLQILAPPGSGKTKTLTSRVAFLLSHCGYKPWNILCLTFTIKSAREMRDRIAKLLGNGLESRLILGTFHSVCRRYLVSYGHLIGLRKGFGIADTSDSSSIIKRIVKRQRLNIDPKKAQCRISSSKSKGIRPADLIQKESKSNNVDHQEFYIVYEAYENQLYSSNLLDYDDLLLKCVDLLRQHSECVSNVEFVLIDEFQDTNTVQYDLIGLFAARNNRITCVGDPDQSIYGWRSAEIKNLARMQAQYPDTLVIHLEDNYRSSGAILLAAAEIIKQDDARPSRPILPTHCPGTSPVLRKLPSAEIEAKWIVSEILRVIGMTGKLLTYADFAILLRSASLSRHIESAMGKDGIPYRMVGGQKFFDRIEIKILLDYLRVISQPKNNDALARIINVPSRGVGLTTVKALLEEAEGKASNLWTLVRDTVQGHAKPKSKISKQAEHSLSLFVNIILTVRNKLLDPVDPHSPEDLLKLLLKKIELRGYLEKSYEDNHEARWANVEELLVQASDYTLSKSQNSAKLGDEEMLPEIKGLEQETGNAAEDLLSKFLANVALATELQTEEKTIEGEVVTQSQVTISTIHAAKGLEWPVVFIPSAYDGSIPHSRAEDTNEERRLLYVAMTRAQALLYISCPIKNSQREETNISPFLSSRKLCCYLDSKGPTLDLETVKDMSKILRRENPSENEIVEKYKLLETFDDNLWPLNGEENPEVTQVKWNRWNQDSTAIHKRRRLNCDSAGGILLPQQYSKDLKIRPLVATTTTMQNSLAFSCHQNYGFSSATAHMSFRDKENHEARPMKFLEEKQRTFSGTDGTYQQGKLGDRNTKPCDDLETQGNLLSYWPVKTNKNNVVAKNPNFAAGLPKLIRINDQPSDLESPGPKGLGNAKDAIAAFRATECYATAPGAIPEALAEHRLPCIKSGRRPYLNSREENSATKPYVFLSSSPPPIQAPCEGDEITRSGAHPRLHTKYNLDQSNSTSKIHDNDVRPAATCHSISMTSVEAASKVPKKTLGIRRSMTGWPSQANQEFSIPNKTKKRY